MWIASHRFRTSDTSLSSLGVVIPWKVLAAEKQAMIARREAKQVIAEAAVSLERHARPNNHDNDGGRRNDNNKQHEEHNAELAAQLEVRSSVISLLDRRCLPVGGFAQSPCAGCTVLRSVCSPVMHQSCRGGVGVSVRDRVREARSTQHATWRCGSRPNAMPTAAGPARARRCFGSAAQ